MEAATLIAAIRDGHGLSDDGAAFIARGLADGSVTDAQAGAFAMAVFLKGTGDAGRVALTRAMRDSGQVLDWSLNGPVVDKHSTGGIGDSTSLILAPVLAACGACVPMISGRGLGHTGGTLDKLEAIPGFVTDTGIARLRQLVADNGCAIVAASGDLAPADRRLYAIRDVTGTVESIDLITASILSKKLAAGLDFLVLDVKAGSGAFMARDEDARALARSLVDTATGAGCTTSALLTDMSQPLGRTAGNAVEVAEVIGVLTGAAPSPALRAVTEALCAEALILTGLTPDPDAARTRVAQLIDDGTAAEHFARMIAAQGGPTDLIERAGQHLPRAPVVIPVPAPSGGTVTRIASADLGRAVVRLGGGRLKNGDPVDPAVGLTGLARVGDRLEAGQPMAMIHARDPAAAERAAATVAAAYSLGDQAPDRPLILDRIR
ncbi:thymidine phosphorylase [Paracoccus sp. p3-h83]|uniref:thymidine phosphorylase n=1 Tax=Paracoccus sp. p3-h83 TaxID=3342805 RepID=UPI0035B75352